MAITTTPLGSDLVLIMDNGTNASGKPLTKSRKYPDVKTGAINDDLYSVATSITGLQAKSLVSIQRQDTIEIQNS